VYRRASAIGLRYDRGRVKVRRPFTKTSPDWEPAAAVGCELGRLIENADEAQRYLANSPGACLVKAYQVLQLHLASAQRQHRADAVRGWM
jgi:hypothetical protein